MSRNYRQPVLVVLLGALAEAERAVSLHSRALSNNDVTGQLQSEAQLLSRLHDLVVVLESFLPDEPLSPHALAIRAALQKWLPRNDQPT